MNASIPAGGAAIRALRWTARSWSLLSIATVLAIDLGEGMNPARFTAPELVLFVFFPLGVCLGMAAAWRWEGLGGGITVVSLCAFYLGQRLVSPFFPRGFAFLTLAAPGFLFVLCSVGSRLAKGRRGGQAPRSA